jgi:uncharacterized protein YdhG (YjbR/CyaY superfamily)
MTADPRVDAYLAALPPEQQRPLQKLRADIARLVPEAIETIGYAMPGFRLDGRFLVSYAGWKRHCSIYPISDALLAKHADAVRGYARTKGSLHFSEGKPLPDALLRDLLEDRVGALRGGSY